MGTLLSDHQPLEGVGSSPAKYPANDLGRLFHTRGLIFKIVFFLSLSKYFHMIV